ncbi:hypothetical protein J3459_011946 [Metarhizium acridum]|nr:hypothetical protein J3459_011946 [Metarhizium acridum]
MKHPGRVRDCCFSPDGRLVASVCGDGRVRLWNSETGKLQQVLDGLNTKADEGVVMSQTGLQGRPILAAFYSEAINVWDVSTGRLLKCLKRVEEKEAGEDYAPDSSQQSESSTTFDVWDITITLSGDKLAAAISNAVHVWDLCRFQKMAVWSDTNHVGNDIRRVKFSADGEFLASCAASEITI